MNIAVLGMGYIGLPTALMLAKNGHDVLGMDINKRLIDGLINGDLPFSETGLEELYNDAKAHFTPSMKLESSEAYIICVPTPLDKEMKMADLTCVRSAIDSITEVIENDQLIILESTVPPGTSKNFLMNILNSKDLDKIHFAHCPERAIPGQTLHELVFNDRIIGGIDEESQRKGKNIYSSFVKGDLYLTDITTSELIKLMENTFRDINIALANEFALIGEELGIDIWEAIRFSNKHPRVNILNPGPGVGGHCIAIDPWFMVEKSSHSKIISLAREINDSMPFHVLKMAKELIDNTGNAVITLLGIAYKGNVDDPRESPAFKVKKIAESEGIEVRVYDPLVKGVPGVLTSLEEAVEGSDCLILITDHDIFRDIDPGKIIPRMKNLIDSRNFLDHSKWLDAGYNIMVLGNGKK